VSDPVRETIIVDASADTVLSTVADVAAYPEWQPEITAVEVVDTGDDGRATKAHFVIDAKLMTVSCTLVYTYDDAGMHWQLVEGDGLTRNDGSYLIDDLGDGRTELTYVLDVEPTMSVPAVLRRQIAKRIVDGALQGAKLRAEGAA